MPVDIVNIYTQAMNAAFINAYNAIAEPPPIWQAAMEVPSKGRIENYPWLYPPPLMREWQGFRQYTTLGVTNYRVPNKTHTAEFQVPYEDLEDDQVNGFKIKAAEMAEGARIYPSIQLSLLLAAGQTTTCFDGTNFFASSHTIGTGNNIVTGTAAASDSVTHAMVCLVTNRTVKPLLWQRREGPNFRTDGGETISSQTRMVKWWSDLRGAAAFGFWFDAVLVKWSNTPTVVEMQTDIGNVNARFRGFTYPKNRPSDPNQYPHGQTKFDSSNMVIVCSSGIDHIVRQALTLSLIAQTENPWRGWATQVTSGYLDSVT